MAKTKWPDEVPVLEASDFCRNVFHGYGSQTGTHCLDGWRLEVFYAGSEVVVLDAIRFAAKAITGDRIFCVWDFNDDLDYSKAVLARVWNLAVAKLGYVGGNPEAKNLKRPKQ